MPNVVSGLKTWLKIAPMLGIAFWLGLFWRRYNGAGARASTLTGFAMWWLTLQPFLVDGLREQSQPCRPGWWSRPRELGWSMSPSNPFLPGSRPMGVVVSVCTRRREAPPSTDFMPSSAHPFNPGKD